MGLSRDQVEQLRSTLKAAPKAPATSVDTTKQEVVKLLAREIQGLQKRGYSLEQIAEMLKGGGLVMSTPTLKSYLSRAKASREHSKEAGVRRKVGKGANALAAAPVTPIVKAGTQSGGAPQTTEKGAGPGASGAAAPANIEVAAVKPTVASAKADEVAAETTDPPKLRSGKEAFLIKDKDSY